MDSCSVYERPFDEPPSPQRFDRLHRLCCLDTLPKTLFLWGQITKIYGEEKSWADFVFRSFVNRKIHQAKKDNRSAFQSEQKHYVSLENYFS